MNTPEDLYHLPFDSILQHIESTLVTLPQHVQYEIVIRDYVGHLLEELSAKIWDPEATSAVARATAYLKQCGVEEEYAERFSHFCLDGIWMLVVGHFPNLTFHEMAAARYVLDRHPHTLLVYMRRKQT